MDAASSGHCCGDAARHEDVQSQTAFYLVVDTTGLYIPYLILGIACGAWSDRNSRKLPLLLPILGHVLSVVVYMVAPFYPGHILATVATGSLCRGLAGKGAIFSSTICSLVSELVPEDQRSKRFAHLLSARYIGICFGYLCAGLLQQHVGVSYSMLTSSAIQLLCAIITVTSVTETIQPTQNTGNGVTSGCEKRERARKIWRNICSWIVGKQLKGTKSMYKCTKSPSLETVVENDSDCTQSAPRTGLLLVVVMTPSFVIQCLAVSHTYVVVLITRDAPLHWPSSWYGYLCALYFGTSGLGLMILAPRLLTLLPQSSNPDVVIVTLSILCCVICSVWSGLAASAGSSWQIFAAYLVGALSLMYGSSTRSLSALCVSEKSHGLLLATQSILENLAKVLGPLAHTAVYVTSLPRHPTLVYYVIAGEAAMLLPVMAWVRKKFGELKTQTSFEVVVEVNGNTTE